MKILQKSATNAAAARGNAVAKASYAASETSMKPAWYRICPANLNFFRGPLKQPETLPFHSYVFVSIRGSVPIFKTHQSTKKHIAKPLSSVHPITSFLSFSPVRPPPQSPPKM